MVNCAVRKRIYSKTHPKNQITTLLNLLDPKKQFVDFLFN